MGGVGRGATELNWHEPSLHAIDTCAWLWLIAAALAGGGATWAKYCGLSEQGQ